MMGQGCFSDVSCNEGNKNWEKLITRPSELYKREDDIRNPFERDYTRILHSLAYRRLKHKTQVFFNIDNDHICTRMEHVAHVESVSFTIAKYLGLNVELTKAIAIGHDLGHAPFGHQGETIINELSEKYLGEQFWHEKNGLRFVDKVELLKNAYNVSKNLSLTYAVRDGIISHCGEVDENGIKPRDELISLDDFEKPSQFQPATWEGCVVKIADKIGYIGRDIEDARSLGFLKEEDEVKLINMARADDEMALNTTVIMHNLIVDICNNSTPEKGICLSPKFCSQFKILKQFNEETIYKNPRLEPFKNYAKLVINEVFVKLLSTYDGKHSWDKLDDEKKYNPTLIGSFEKYLAEYCSPEIVPTGELKRAALGCDNEKIYGDLSDEKLYIHAILDYISGMSDRYAVKVFNELLTY